MDDFLESITGIEYVCGLIESLSLMASIDGWSLEGFLDGICLMWRARGLGRSLYAFSGDLGMHRQCLIDFIAEE